MTKILKIKLGQEYKAHVDNIKEFEDSIFSQLYQRSKHHINDIIKQSEDSENYYNPENYNNIIAFTGERGTGKTSAMTSLVKSLNEPSFAKFEGTKDKYKFAVLETIDPSLFRNKDRLFEIIITKMFAKFQHTIRTENGNVIISQENKRKLIDTFQKVYSDLKILNQDKQSIYEKEVIEALSDLAYGSNLKNKFQELVQIYLEVIENQSDFLIISIDDFDLNIEGAYDMLEDIRQFLIQNKIIIFIACKIEQLKDTLREEIVSKTKNLYRKEILELDGFYTEDVPKEKAEKYLEKLIPADRRLHTENINIDNNILVRVINSTGKIIHQDSSAQKLIIKLIYKKTGLFLPIVTNAGNYFIGKTLRQLIHQIAFLNQCQSLEQYKNLISKQKIDFLTGADLAIYDESNQNINLLHQFYQEWYTLKLQKYLNVENSVDQIYSFSDVFKTYTTLGEKMNIIDFSEQKSGSFLALNYSINNQLIYNKNKNSSPYIQNHYIHNFFIENLLYKGEKSLSNKNTKDSFRLEGLRSLMDQFKNENEFQFVLCFISILGREKNLTREELNRYIEWKDKKYNIAQFSANNFISVLYNQDIKFLSQRSINGEHENSFINEIRNWQFNGMEHFTNLFFVTIFKQAYNIWYERNRRDGLFTNLPGKELKYKIVDGYKGALTIMLNRFDYIDFDIEQFMTNPIFKYWEENEERVNYLFNIIYESYYNSKSEISNETSLTILARNLLNQYSRYFNSTVDNTMGIKMAMNNLIKQFKGNSNIYIELQSFRREMDIDLIRGLKNIENKLIEISNNG